MKLNHFRWIVRILFVGLFFFTEGFENEIWILFSFLLLGGLFCGWFCPFGAISDIATFISKKIFGKKLMLKVPEKLDRYGRYLKYVFLGMFVFVIISKGIDYFYGDHPDMYMSTTPTFIYWKAKKISIYVIALFIPRFFCKYLCFQKGAYNIMQKIGLVSIARNSSCNSCTACDRVCPMGIKISENNNSKIDCIGCMECVENSCKSKKALSLSYGKDSIDYKKFTFFAMLIYVVFTAFIVGYEYMI